MARLTLRIITACGVLGVCLGLQIQENQDPEKVQATCDGLVRASRSDLIVKDPLCAGDIQYSPELRQRGLAEPVHCLRDKLPSVVAKMCQMCVFKFKKGWPASINRTSGHCSDRYKMMNHIVGQLNTGDGAAAVAVLRQVAAAIGEMSSKFQNFDEAVAFYRPQFAATEAGRKLIDMDRDGTVEVGEMKAFMQSGYIFADMAQEVVIENPDLSPQQLAEYTTTEQVDFMDWWNRSK